MGCFICKSKLFFWLYVNGLIYVRFKHDLLEREFLETDFFNSSFVFHRSKSDAKFLSSICCKYAIRRILFSNTAKSILWFPRLISETWCTKFQGKTHLSHVRHCLINANAKRTNLKKVICFFWWAPLVTCFVKGWSSHW